MYSGDCDVEFVPEDVLNMLIRKAGRGHGGEMTEEYMIQNTYQNQATWMKEAYENAASGAKKPDIVKALYISVKAVILKNSDVTINGEGIRAEVEKVHKNPAFERFSADPDISTLFINREFRELQMKWGDAVNSFKKENIIQGGQNQAHNPGQNPIPKEQAPEGPAMHN